LARQAKAYLVLSLSGERGTNMPSGLSQLPIVLIDERGGYKFIVAVVNDGETSKMVVRADASCEFHRDILRKLRFEAPGINAQCVGGGRINIDPIGKVIDIWSSSGDFGIEPNRAETVRLLSEAFPGFDVRQKNSR